MSVLMESLICYDRGDERGGGGDDYGGNDGYANIEEKMLQRLAKIICEVFGDDDAAGESTVQRWSAKFKAGEFSLEDESHSGKIFKIG
ncbi:Hypothetical predicted protein [Octopus vulgaris]|uniref:Mos1 transposase HTH domain-containing protein n=1 Tax=Octopus vulgaris TaxID=6645 RepID=A0AA36BK92_OCTVU|nr:Hypothetical predicted protein [Octopus vulgaris]